MVWASAGAIVAAAIIGSAAAGGGAGGVRSPVTEKVNCLLSTP